MKIKSFKPTKVDYPTFMVIKEELGYWKRDKSLLLDDVLTNLRQRGIKVGRTTLVNVNGRKNYGEYVSFMFSRNLKRRLKAHKKRLIQTAKIVISTLGIALLTLVIIFLWRFW